MTRRMASVEMCDRCGTEHIDEDGLDFDDLETLLEGCGWVFTRRTALCPDCAPEDDA